MSKEDVLIDMMERGREGNLSATDCQTIEEDEDMRQMAKDILTASATIHHQREKVNVEDRLAKFKASHQKNEVEREMIVEQPKDEENKTETTEGEKTKMIILKPWLLIAAAMIVCAFFLFYPYEKKEKQTDYTAENIQMESENGETYTLPMANQGDEALSRTTVVDAKKMPEAVTMTIPYGQEAVVNLADGSKVHLHPGSKLHFPNKFVDKERVVTLEGEAYFEVAHNPQQPFIVKTDMGQTKVLGTEFDVTAYAGKPVSVTLIKGKVEVQNASHATALSPGKKAVWDEKGEIATSDVDTEPYTLWRDGYLYYDNTPLDDILDDISRYYKVNIKYQAHEVHQYRMRFMVNRSESLEDVVNAINMMQKVQARLVDSNTIVVE